MSTTSTVTLSELVEKRRNELGLDKSAAARRAKISRGTWHEIEAGLRPDPRPETLLRIDRALDWPAGHLYNEMRRVRRGEDADIFITGAPLADDDAKELRRKLTNYSFTLTLEEVVAVIGYIESGGTNRNVIDELDSIQAQLTKLRNAVTHGAVPENA